MQKEQMITQYLKNTYNPVAILLHGSRAAGMERTHSDWDVIMLFAGDVPRPGYREQVEEEDVEWKAYTLPITDDGIIKTVGTYLQFAKVLWEEEGVGSELLSRAQKEYAKGPQIDMAREQLFFAHKIAGMEDDKSSPYMFMRHLARFFAAATDAWFLMLHHEYSKPFYIAMPRVEKEDPEYYSHLMTLCDDTATREAKIESARWLRQRLFT